MPYGLSGKPLLVAVAVLFAIVFARAQLTYWLARGLTEGTLRSHWSARVSGPRVQRAALAINRWGAPVVTVSFFTVGFQTVMNAAAGLSRMPFPRYLLAMLPGCVAWAVIYATVGLAAFNTAFLLAARSPWALVGVVTAIAGLVGFGLWWHQRHQRHRRTRLADRVEDRG